MEAANSTGIAARHQCFMDIAWRPRQTLTAGFQARILFLIILGLRQSTLKCAWIASEITLVLYISVTCNRKIA